MFVDVNSSILYLEKLQKGKIFAVLEMQISDSITYCT